jgi:hypothetical protein
VETLQVPQRSLIFGIAPVALLSPDC